MADRLLPHHMSVVAPATICISLLLLLAALGAPSATTAAAAKKQVGMRIRYADKEEAQWLDRYAETHQPLGAGPLRLVRATPEQEHWLNRLSNDDVATTERAHAHDGGAGGSSGGGGYIDFDDDNPYVDALRDWVVRLTKQSMEKAEAQPQPEDL